MLVCTWGAAAREARLGRFLLTKGTRSWTAVAARRTVRLMPNLFVSHSARDRAAVSTFVDTIIKLGCGLSDNPIFYSSGAATGVPIGKDLNTYVQGQVSEADLVLAVITPAFRESNYCIAELGAAWSRAGHLFPSPRQERAMSTSTVYSTAC